MDDSSKPQDIPGSRRSSFDESESRRSSMDSVDSMRQGSVDAMTDQQKGRWFWRAKGTKNMDLPPEFKDSFTGWFSA
jgi:hypothetical protein